MSLETLYHYTDIVGMFGIFCNKTIWATSVSHQRDETEIDYAINLARIIVTQRLNLSDSQSATILLGKISELLSRGRDELIAHYRVYAASFSKRRDSKNQWREYCPRGEGFSIGFDSLQLISDRSQTERPFNCQICEYDVLAQAERIRGPLDEILQKWHGISEDKLTQNDVNSAAEGFIARLLDDAPSIKSSKFREEQEVRLVSHGQVVDPHWKVRYRKNGSKSIPFYELSLTQKSEKLRVPELVLSPTKDREGLRQKAEQIKQVFQDQVEIGSIQDSGISYTDLWGAEC